MKDKYCRCCGRLLDEKIDNNNEIYMYCNSCDKRYYENAICAIICAIKYQDKYLVVKQPHINDSYSLISGFVNINESLEECVKREIKEELGIELLSNIKYINSYPYNKKDMIMIGFLIEINNSLISTNNEISSYEFVKYDKAIELLKNARIASKLMLDIGDINE
jgi:NAD+ diphosphatase